MNYDDLLGGNVVDAVFGRPRVQAALENEVKYQRSQRKINSK